MNEGKTFFDLPQADTVPAGSRYAVEMGDGSGTKSVTHEDVVKAVGGDLPLGETKNLETIAKDTFVDAINEIKRRTDSASGGATIKVLTTDPALYGRVVSVTDGETTLTGSMAYTGECIISGVLINGNLTVSASTEEGATAETTVMVTNYATYSAELDTRGEYNRIDIKTAETGLYGRTVTVSNGTDSETGTIGNDGTAKIRFSFSGPVTVTASDGANTASASLNIPAEGVAIYSVDLQLYHLTVTTADTKLNGKAVTLVCGSHTRTGTFAGGVATITFDSNFMGECLINASDGSRNGTVKIHPVQNMFSYNVTMTLAVVYSALIDFSKSVPDKMVTYTDDAEGMEHSFASWRDMPIFKEMRPCVLKDGKVLYYLNPDNLAQKADGSAADITTLGNDVMLEIPFRVGYSIEWVNAGKNLLKVSVTNDPDNDAFKYDAFSLNAYNDCDRIYIGVYKGHCTGNKAYSSSGKAVTVSQTIDTFRTWCRARGAGYQQRTYGSLKLMQCLFIISHGTLNSQSAVGMGYVKSDHTAGVVTGGTNAYGADSEIIRTSNPTYMTDQNHQVKCLNLEDFWGNYWEFIDGLTSDANRNVMTCDIAKNFVTNGTGYKNNGNGGVSANIANYMKLPQGGSDAGFTARDVSGSDSTYFTDYAYLYASCLAIFGGSWSYALIAGAFLLAVTYAFSLSYASVGCRLMFMHEEEKEEEAA